MNSTVMVSLLSIATSIIHAASQVCSTSGISGTDDPLPSPGPVAVNLKPTSPATNQPLSSPSTPKVSQVSPSTAEVSEILPSTLEGRSVWFLLMLVGELVQCYYLYFLTFFQVGNLHLLLLGS